jgi:hypothetical protein
LLHPADLSGGLVAIEILVEKGDDPVPGKRPECAGLPIRGVDFSAYAFKKGSSGG